MAMNCPECGVPVEPDARFCPQCFARIEPPGLWRRFLSLFQATGSPAGPRRIVTLKKSVTIKTADEAGVKHEYHSLDELPPELRAEVKELEAQALKENVASAHTVISRTKSEIYKIKDAAGNERIYHSLDELPPEIRAAVEQARKKSA
jgi:hypothetical protein